MACCKIHCKRILTRSERLAGLRKLRKRLVSHVTAFKFIQLVLASAGMSLHVCQPFYRSLVDSTLVPGVLCSFSIVSFVLLFGHLFNCTAPIRLNATFSTVASLGYGWCMSAVMDSTKTEENRTAWSFLLAKGIVCFAALAIHLLELLHAYVNRDSRPLSLRSTAPSRSLSRAGSSHPVHNKNPPA